MQKILEHEALAYNHIGKALSLQIQRGKEKLGLKDGEKAELYTLDSPEFPGVQRIYVLQVEGSYAQFLMQLGFLIGELDYTVVVSEVEVRLGRFDPKDIKYGEDEA